MFDQTTILNQAANSRKRRSLNGQPVSLYVEYLAVVEPGVFTKYQNLYGFTDNQLVFQYLKIHVQQIVNSVRNLLPFNLSSELN